MVVFNYSGSEINAKIVYYGPALGGKTTNLEHIYERMPSDSKGKMVSMKTRTDRTLFFDFLPIELGAISGFKTRMLLYTVPGQVYYNATRKLVLKGADAVVFVADSDPAKLKENIESLRNLEENLNEHDLTLDTIPWVMQYNKRDLPDALPVSTLDAELNLLSVPSFEGVATEGKGVYETFQAIVGMLYKQLADRLEQSGEGDGAQPADIQIPDFVGELAGAQTPQPAADNSAAYRPATAGQSQDRLTPPAAGESAGVQSPSAAGPPGDSQTPHTADDVDPSVSEALDVALREVDDLLMIEAEADKEEPQSAAAAEGVSEATGTFDESEDESFQFESLEKSRIDQNVGRVIDLEETAVEPLSDPSAGDSNGEFITNPCTTADTPPPREEEKVSDSVTSAQEATLEQARTAETPPSEDILSRVARATETPPDDEPVWNAQNRVSEDATRPKTSMEKAPTVEVTATPERFGADVPPVDVVASGGLMDVLARPAKDATPRETPAAEEPPAAKAAQPEQRMEEKPVAANAMRQEGPEEEKPLTAKATREEGPVEEKPVTAKTTQPGQPVAEEPAIAKAARKEERVEEKSPATKAPPPAPWEAAAPSAADPPAKTPQAEMSPADAPSPAAAPANVPQQGSSQTVDAGHHEARDPRTRLAEISAMESRDKRADHTEDECVITVPVLLKRSQIRKTIPIKLSLEIQVVDDDL